MNQNGKSVLQRQYTPEGKYFWSAEEKGVLVKNAVIQDEGMFSCLLRYEKSIFYMIFYYFRFRKNGNDEESEFTSYTNLAVLRKPKLLNVELKQNYITLDEKSGLEEIAVCEYDPGRPAATVRWVDGLEGSALPSNFFKTSITR